MVELDESRKALAATTAAEHAARSEAEGLRQHLGDARYQAATAEARVREIEKRADDLSAELGRVNKHSSDLIVALTAQKAGSVKTQTAPKSAG
jgi:predicted  nucleic acid-binding Zn-ribbon protein